MECLVDRQLMHLDYKMLKLYNRDYKLDSNQKKKGNALFYIPRPNKRNLKNNSYSRSFQKIMKQI